RAAGHRADALADRRARALADTAHRLGDAEVSEEVAARVEHVAGAARELVADGADAGADAAGDAGETGADAAADATQHGHESRRLTFRARDRAAGLGQPGHDAADRLAAAGHDAAAEGAAHATHAAETAGDVAADGARRVRHASRRRADAAADAGDDRHEARGLTFLARDRAARLRGPQPQRASHATPNRVPTHRVTRDVHRSAERVPHVGFSFFSSVAWRWFARRRPPVSAAISSALVPAGWRFPPTSGANFKP